MIRAALLATASFTAALVLSPITAEAREVTCEAGTRLKAKNGDTKSTITFTNRTPDKQMVYWVDYDGKRHKYQELDPGESYEQPTFLTHPWLVTGVRGTCVGYYLADGKKTSVEPGISPVIKPINAPKKKKLAQLPKKLPKALPRVGDRVTISKPAAKVRVPKISDDDFDDEGFDDARDDDRDETTIARKRTENRRADDSLSDYDYEEDEDNAQDDLPKEGQRLDDQDLRDDDEDDVAIAEPLPRVNDRGRPISPEWGDAPTTTGRTGISKNWRCTEYNSRTEAAICSNPRLSRLDDELERLYSTLVRQLPGPRRTRIRRRQQRWLENRESCGRRVECIERRTERRLARLNERMERVISRRARPVSGVRPLCRNVRYSALVGNAYHAGLAHVEQFALEATNTTLRVAASGHAIGREHAGDFQSRVNR